MSNYAVFPGISRQAQRTQVTEPGYTQDTLRYFAERAKLLRQFYSGRSIT